MRTNAAVLFEQPGPWKVVEVELDPPKSGEVLVQMVATGLCHSDDHLATGDVPFPLPVCGGHEGGGIVRAVGPGVTTLKEGDHVLTQFIATCGRCKWCAAGMQNLCDNGRFAMDPAQLDGTFRMHYEGQDVGLGIGTFSEWQVFDEMLCVQIAPDLPLDVTCLVACGVPTGWGSAVNAAEIRPGQTVIVMGCGGVGMSAVQGARHAGASHIVAVDPVESKREVAMELGATSAFSHISEAADFARSVTNGQGADSTIITVGVIRGERIVEALDSIRKAGTVAVTAQGAWADETISLNLYQFSMYQKRLQGVVYGNASPRGAIQLMLDLYQAGQLKLDEMVTKRYRLDQINDAYDDMRSGKNVRGVVEFT